jgi:predicted ArsR family transcriptional regulator
MSEQTNHVSSKEVRNAIVRRIELEDSVTLGVVVSDISQELGVKDSVVRRQFSQLEQADLVHAPSGTLDPDAEVTAP